MLELIGWLGGILLTFCGVPLAWQTYKDGHAQNLNLTFLNMWLGGEILVLIYVIPKGLLPLIINYSFNTILILIILYYKFRPRED